MTQLCIDKDTVQKLIRASKTGDAIVMQKIITTMSVDGWYGVRGRFKFGVAHRSLAAPRWDYEEAAVGRLLFKYGMKG